MDPIKRVAVIDILRTQAFFLNNTYYRHPNVSQEFKGAIILLRKLYLEATENVYTRHQIANW
ncbi:hypothetical protein PENANT_c028G02449 [Penicillium antarcticum]|uniref:Uncharacterized protein n=1 Tax=Penicillium antarcticum TaxID=416450 RepID=A0A1V6PWF6_9EURO|nr:hypothetical protein PENANT_c028G02449 [Penicillium antarcticum]